MNHSFLLITVYSLHFICSVFNISTMLTLILITFLHLSMSYHLIPFAFFLIFLLFLIIFRWSKRKSIQFSFQFL